MNVNGEDQKGLEISQWPKVQLEESARRVRNEEQAFHLARNGVNRCGLFVTLAR